MTAGESPDRWTRQLADAMMTPKYRSGANAMGQYPIVRSRLTARIAYIALALATIAGGLWVHQGGAGLSTGARDVLGDALWAAMIAWGLGAVAPDATLMLRSAVAFVICALVELSQLIHAPAIDAIRRSTVGHLVLGSGFDRRDLLAYAAGVSVAALLEWRIRRPRLPASAT